MELKEHRIERLKASYATKAIYNTGRLINGIHCYFSLHY